MINDDLSDYFMLQGNIERITRNIEEYRNIAKYLCKRIETTQKKKKNRVDEVYIVEGNANEEKALQILKNLISDENFYVTKLQNKRYQNLVKAKTLISNASPFMREKELLMLDKLYEHTMNLVVRDEVELEKNYKLYQKLKKRIIKKIGVLPQEEKEETLANIYNVNFNNYDKSIDI